MGELELTESHSSNWVVERGLNGQRVRGGQTRRTMGSAWVQTGRWKWDVQQGLCNQDGCCPWKMREHTMIDKAMRMQVKEIICISSSEMSIDHGNYNFFLIGITFHLRHFTEGIESFELMSGCFIS